VTSSHSECSAGNWLPGNNFCIVQYRSECIYILQINFIKKYIYIFSFLQLIEIYGFCEGEDRL
jgi:hypothetical protein